MITVCNNGFGLLYVDPINNKPDSILINIQIPHQLTSLSGNGPHLSRQVCIGRDSVEWVGKSCCWPFSIVLQPLIRQGHNTAIDYWYSGWQNQSSSNCFVSFCSDILIAASYFNGTDRFRHLYMKNKHLIACTVSKLDPKKVSKFNLKWTSSKTVKSNENSVRCKE